MNTQALSKYNQLENMGFGLKKLQFLWTTVNEIAFENNLPVQNAVEKFLSDIEQQYDSKLGFESKIKDLRDEINKLNHELNRVRSELLLMPLVGPKIIKLTQSGVSEADIINIAALFEKNIPGFKLQSFISELEKYGSLKSNIERLVSIQAIKNEVIMAIEVMQSKLGVNDRLREILSNTLIALTGKTDN